MKHADAELRKSWDDNAGCQPPRAGAFTSRALKRRGAARRSATSHKARPHDRTTARLSKGLKHILQMREEGWKQGASQDFATVCYVRFNSSRLNGEAHLYSYLEFRKIVTGNVNAYFRMFIK